MTLPLNVDSRGAGGTPVLFVHSFAGDLSHWSAQLEHLKAARRAVAFDLSGHGKSPGAVGAYSIHELAKDVGAVADAQALDRFVLVGHSLGAQVAIEYAALHPRRVAALGLIDAPPAPGAMLMEQQQIRAAVMQDPFATIEQFWKQGAFQNSPPATQVKLLESLRRLSRQAATDLTIATLGFDATTPLREYHGPKFAIVTPSNDAPLSLHNATRGIQHTVIKGTGHWIHLDKPVEFNAVLDIFLRGL